VSRKDPPELEPRVRRLSDGSFVVDLSENERSLLASLPAQLSTILEDEADDPWLQRLFPTAYPKDADREEEWRLLMSVDLHDRRRAQLQVLADTAGSASLSADELLTWSQALNDLRLYLGTRLDLIEETTEEDFEDEDDRDLYSLYGWLSFVQGEVVDALSEAL